MRQISAPRRIIINKDTTLTYTLKTHQRGHNRHTHQLKEKKNGNHRYYEKADVIKQTPTNARKPAKCLNNTIMNDFQ